MIQKFNDFLRNRGIQSRIFLAFIVLPLLVMGLMFLLYYFSSTSVVVEKNKESSKMTIELTEENMKLNVSNIEEQLTNIIQLIQMMKAFEEVVNEDEKQMFETYLKDNRYLEGRKYLTLYDSQGSLLYNENGEDGVSYGEVTSRFDVDGSSDVWIYDNEHKEVQYIQRILDESQTVGYAMCGFSEAVFQPSNTNVNNEHVMLVVVDENDRYLFGSSKLKHKTKIDTTSDEVTLKDRKYYVESKKISNMDWNIVNLVSRNYLLEEFFNFRNMIFLYGIIVVVLLEIIAAFVYRSIYDPINNLLKTMRNVDENNLVASRLEDHGKDEMHEVVTNFNDLLDRVGELMKTVEMEQEQKRITQFQLLQAQINPHFLFNTLNTLHFLAIMNEDKPVSEGISALAKLLRNTIVDSKELVTVDEEIENLKNYIIIQKLRFGDLFETVYNIDKNVKDCKILKFLLQPIVENSILHAFEEDEQHQILIIRIKEQDNYLMIEIGDNGKGFQQDLKEKKKTALSGIGIDNIQERIQLMYGESYSMKIKSVPHVGTVVTLRLPYVKGERYV